jgi:hypothetical protein
VLWAHAETREKLERLRAVNHQQLLMLDAAGVQALGCPEHRQASCVVCQQHAAAVASKLLQIAPEQFAI